MRSRVLHGRAAVMTMIGAGTVAVTCAAACTSTPQAVGPTTVVISTVWMGSAWGQVGQALAAAYTQRIPHVTANAIISAGLEQTADAVEAGQSDLAIEDAETAYIAYSMGTKDNPRPHRNIRGISVLFSTAVQLVVNGDSTISKIADLRGRRVDVGQEGTPVERAARLILRSHGLSYASIKPVFGSGNSLDALRSHELDARFFYTPYPQSGIGELARTGSIRLVSIERESLAAIQEEHHFLKSLIIPSATYSHQEQPVLTVGMDVLLLCRQDLPTQLVHDLTATLFDSIRDLTAANAAAGAIDPDRGPTTAVPLHAGAVRYYREREILK